MRARWLAILLLIGLVAACGSPLEICTVETCDACCDISGQCGACSPFDAGALNDAMDASRESLDGGSADASGVDSGLPDAGALDAGATDAGARDAGFVVVVGALTISGHASYELVPATYDQTLDVGTLDFAHAVQKPIRGADVRVVEGTQVIASAVTGLDGAYTLSFVATGAGAVSVQLLARSATPAITVQDNTSSNAVWALSAPVPASGGTVDLLATHGWKGSAYDPTARIAAPFAILDTMLTATNALLTARPTLVLPKLGVNWSPRNSSSRQGTFAQGDIGTTSYSAHRGEIFVLGKELADTDEFDTHVLVHEFGHFLEHKLSRSDAQGGSHAPADLLDPRDAFSEGWGDGVAAVLLADPIYADTQWSGPSITAFGWDTETPPTPTDDPNPGPFSEASIMRLVYDLYDSANEGAFDTTSLGVGPFIDALVGTHRVTPSVTTLASFITGVKASPGVNAGAIDTALAHFGIGPISNDFGAGDSALESVFARPSAFPYSRSVSFDARLRSNTRDQNAYVVLTSTGQPFTVSVTASKDVGAFAYRQGREVAYADKLGGGGTETFTLTADAGVITVVNVVGYGTGSTSYPVTLSVTSP